MPNEKFIVQESIRHFLFVLLHQVLTRRRRTNEESGSAACRPGDTTTLDARGKSLHTTVRLPVLCRHDDFGNVVSVAIDRHAPLEDIERDALFLQVTIIDAGQRRELGAGGMSSDKDSLRVSVSSASRLNRLSQEGQVMSLSDESSRTSSGFWQ